MQECFIVVHTNYADGIMAYAFWTEEDAKKDIDRDVEAVVDSLVTQGYDPEVTHGTDSAEIYVADSNIYYEWSIVTSQIK